MNIIKNITNVNFTKGNTGRKYIVIHYTGNKTDTAKANSNYFKSENRQASAHFFVDEMSIYQVVNEEDTAWSVGVNYGSNNLFGKCKNSNSISIEMCSTNGIITEKTFNNTVELTKSLMKKYDIPLSNVVRHYDVCSKKCPGWIGWGEYTGDSSVWNKFKSKLYEEDEFNLVFTYQVMSSNKIYPEVKNLDDYAGVNGVPIENIRIKANVGFVEYRVHVCGEGWLPYVDGYSWNDHRNGYAGNGKPIDAITVVYHTPSDIVKKYGYKKAKYRVSPLNKEYYSWQHDAEKDECQDGYAGCFGKAIDRFQIH